MLKSKPYYIKRSAKIYEDYGLFELLYAIKRTTELNLISNSTYFKLKYLLKGPKNPMYLQYDYVAHPLKIISVDPSHIKKISTTPGIKKWRKSGKIKSGNWDIVDEEFNESYDLYRGFKNHFNHGITWEDTDFYERVLAQINSGNPKWGCHTETDLKQRCEKLDSIYSNIRSEGYKSRREIVNEGLNKNDDPFAIRSSYLDIFDEVAVDIGRDGSFLFVDGRNRLAIAKILDVKTIPVRVVMRHKNWQEIREAVGNGDYSQKYGNHPDLEDVGT